MQKLWYAPTFICPTLIAAGALGAWSGALPTGAGFFLFFLGLGLAVVSFIGLAGAAALGTALGKTWRPAAVRAAIVPGLIAIPLFVLRGTNDAPAINDISTDLEDRPGFTPDVAAALPDQAPPQRTPEQLDYFSEVQREAYPDLAPIRLDAAPAEVLARAEAAAKRLGWTVVTSDPARGQLEAYESSRIFRFRDDVVVRVRAEGSGSRVDVRSRSRLGIGDMGVNAARIRAFRDALASGG